MMDQLRAYVWAQAMAGKLSIHNLPVEQAAKDADVALAEFDKRTFNELTGAALEEAAGKNAELEMRVQALEAELAQVQAEVIAPNPENDNKAAQFDQVDGLVADIALPGETVVEVVERLKKATL